MKTKISKHNKTIVDTQLMFRNLSDVLAIRNYLEEIVLKTLKLK